MSCGVGGAGPRRSIIDRSTSGNEGGDGLRAGGRDRVPRRFDMIFFWNQKTTK